ncbi:monothiol glutaredoxin-5 [Cristinia sonorae]|uniref:Monothiol glutaredoxin-5, mitochondrial n=1 Tax=Cristinia sonorae TaxID=1940300 RepID=A0A8K0UUZ5_9AGAR|nr:monothiol glutaredoxin-5 [Cristinia sonorae]
MLRTALRASHLQRGVMRTPLLAPSSLTIARRFISQETRAKIQDAVNSTPVVLFMKGTPDAPQCGFSRATVQILDLQGVPPEKLKTFNVLEDAELRTAIKEFSEWPTIPQVYVNGEFVGGCDIILGMHQSGELETLLEKQGVIPPIEGDAKASS